jgi:hypothetical protein
VRDGSITALSRTRYDERGNMGDEKLLDEIRATIDQELALAVDRLRRELYEALDDFRQDYVRPLHDEIVYILSVLDRMVR